MLCSLPRVATKQLVPANVSTKTSCYVPSVSLPRLPELVLSAMVRHTCLRFRLQGKWRSAVLALNVFLFALRHGHFDSAEPLLVDGASALTCTWMLQSSTALNLFIHLSSVGGRDHHVCWSPCLWSCAFFSDIACSHTARRATIPTVREACLARVMLACFTFVGHACSHQLVSRLNALQAKIQTSPSLFASLRADVCIHHNTSGNENMGDGDSLMIMLHSVVDDCLNILHKIFTCDCPPCPTLWETGACRGLRTMVRCAWCSLSSPGCSV